MPAQQTVDAMVEDKINTLMPYLVKTAGGDEGLIQEGAIGIWQSMKAVQDRASRIFVARAALENGFCRK